MPMVLFSLIKTIAISGVLLASTMASPPPGEHVLAKKDFSLENRYPNAWVNEVFSDNIALTIRYMDNPSFERPSDSDFKKVREPFETSFVLKPGETFAYQEDVLPEFEGKVAKTTNAHFNFEQGFRSSGYLTGDGVCHLASFINMAAREAGLEVVAPTSHDFAVIPDIPREYGTSIFYSSVNEAGNVTQNLYITNNLDKEVTFTFTVEKDLVKLQITKQK